MWKGQILMVASLGALLVAAQSGLGDAAQACGGDACATVAAGSTASGSWWATSTHSGPPGTRIVGQLWQGSTQFTLGTIAECSGLGECEIRTLGSLGATQCYYFGAGTHLEGGQSTPTRIVGPVCGLSFVS